ncbi:MAG: DnaB-like helicase C-terminal domain-containing protein, partial [Patescibacteria group bacterium]|nr:DnaB-like helicase C-terminal domain-containing protein [Patescibacteria group bacterium]
ASVNEIRTKARRLQSEHGLGLLIIDYLQLMEGASGTENRVQEVSEISRALKAIARELNIPVLALSQLSRATEARTPAIPKLADLRESGSLEQDADVVLFIYRKAMDKSIKFCPPEEKNVAEIHIGKHRHGPAGGIVKLYFEAETASYKNLDKKMLDNLEGDSSDIEESGPF